MYVIEMEDGNTRKQENNEDVGHTRTKRRRKRRTSRRRRDKQEEGAGDGDSRRAVPKSWVMAFKAVDAIVRTPFFTERVRECMGENVRESQQRNPTD